MRLVPDQNQKLVVSRGYLTGMSALPAMLAGTSLVQSDTLAVWAGIALIAIGVGLLVWAFPHLMTPPMPLNQEQDASQG